MARLVKGNFFMAMTSIGDRSLRYSGAKAGRCSTGMALWDTKGNSRSRSGPEGKLVGVSVGGTMEGRYKGKGRSSLRNRPL